MKRLILAILLLPLILFAQKESYNWYFGNKAGISFIPDINNPRVLKDCPVGFGYASATISDKDGNLQFYTNGDSILNRNHRSMTNSFKMTTFFSNAEGATIVPVVNKLKMYYVFLTDSLAKSGLWYSIVDMAGEYGNGVVSVFMRKISGSRKSSIEAVKHENNRDIWLVTKDYLTDRFCSYHLTKEGISDSVVSNFNATTGIQYFLNSTTDGSRLATASYNDSSFYLFDFNKQTGVVSNKIHLKSYDFDRPTAVEFSYNSSKLYIDCLTYSNTGRIYQLDLSSGDSATIVNSRTLLDDNTQTGNYDAIQIGPDHKLYASYHGSSYLSVINNPDLFGTNCNFQRNGIFLRGSTCYLDLPDFIYDYLHYGVGGTPKVCENETIYLYADYGNGAVYNWSGPDGFTSSLPNPFITNAKLSNQGYYVVSITNIPEPVTDSIYVTVSPLFSAYIRCNGDTNICPGTSVILDALPNDAGYSFKWSTGETVKSIKVSKEGTYTVSISNVSGCTVTASITIHVLEQFNARIISSGKRKCFGDTLLLKAHPSDSGYKFIWSTGDTTPEISINKSKIISLSIISKYGCISKVTQSFVFNDLPVFSLTPRKTASICEGQTLKLSIKEIDPNLKFEWSTGDTGKVIFVNQAGIYIVTATNSTDCQSSDSVEVFVLPSVNVSISANGPLVFCFGDSVVLTGEPFIPGTYCSWSNGAVTEKIVVKTSGMYIYTVMNTNGCEYSDTITVKVSSKLTAGISGNKVICQGESTLLYAEPRGSNYYYKWSTGSVAPFIYATDSGYYWVKVYLNATCEDSVGIFIIKSKMPKAEIKIASDRPFCKGTLVLLKAFPRDSNYTYLWSNGEKTQDISISDSGTYYCTVTNEYGCSSKSANLLVQIFERPDAKILISGKKEICKGESVTLVASPTGSGLTYLWSTGETTQSIKVDETGKYTLIVTQNGECSDSDAVEIKVYDLLQPEITGDTLICRGISNKLSVKSDYASYLWSTDETSKEIAVDKEQEYKVTVTDSNGCKGTASIFVKFFRAKLDGLENIDFATVRPNSSSTSFLNIKNTSGVSLKIKNIYLKNSANVFKIKSLLSLPLILDTEQLLKIEILFEPLSTGDYSDFIMFELEEPCNEILFATITGKSDQETFKSLIWLPDTNAKIGDENFCIPIYAKRNKDVKINNKIGFDADISFEPTILLPLDLPNNVVNGKRIVHLEVNDIDFSNEIVKLGEFCCKVFIGEQDKATLYISNFEWKNITFDNEFKNGTLTVVGMCQPGIARLMLSNTFDFEILPNPSSDYITISLINPLLNNRVDEVEIYDMLGVKTTFTPTLSQKAGGYIVDVSGFAPGLYFLRLGDRVNKFIKM